MQKWKLSFAGIIAMCILGFTIVSNAGVLNVREVRAIDCYRPPFEVRSTCISAIVTVSRGNICSAAKVGDHVFSLSTTVVDNVVHCNDGIFICCIRVENDPVPCADQPAIDPPGFLPLGNYRVANVYCKSTADFGI